MSQSTFRFCAENITKPAGEYESLKIEKFNDDAVEVIRTITQRHPDIRERHIDGKSDRKVSSKFSIKNFGYKTVTEAMEYFNQQLKQ